MNLLTVSGIYKEEEKGAVLADVSFTQQMFQKIAIAGETGSGKSTLLKIIAGLVQADAGEVYFRGEKVKGPAEKLVPGHPQIAYLSQQFELAPFLRVEQVLKYANTLSADEAEKVYEVCKIEHLLKQKTDQLSGGEKQRVAIARLLISSPRLLLLDEPYSNLDNIHKNILKTVIRDIGERLNISCIIVSHDPLDTLPWADEILVMKAGGILQQGSPEQVYGQPVNEYVAGLFGKYNLIPPALGKSVVGLTENMIDGQHLMIRPENIKIVAAANGELSGKVQQISFYGSFYEVEVQLPTTMIIVRTAACNLVPGSDVKVSASADAVWWV